MVASYFKRLFNIGGVDPLIIQSKELVFDFELNNQISSFVTLHNKGHQWMAFKVKTTNPKKYAVRPVMGVVLSGSFCDITVTMAAQEEAPPDMKCIDKFLIQSVAVPVGTNPKDLTCEMFNKEKRKVVKKLKLRVAYSTLANLEDSW